MLDRYIFKADFTCCNSKGGNGYTLYYNKGIFQVKQMEMIYFDYCIY